MPISTAEWNINQAIDDCLRALGKHESFISPNDRPLYITLMLAYTVNIMGYARTISNLNEIDRYSCIPLICRSILELYADLKDFFHKGSDINDIVRLHYLRDMVQSKSEYRALREQNKLNAGKYQAEMASYIDTFEEWLGDHFTITVPSELKKHQRASWILKRIDELEVEYMSKYINNRCISTHIEYALKSNDAYKEKTGKEYEDSDMIYAYLSSEIHSIISVVDKRATSSDGLFSFDQPTKMVSPSIGLTYWCVVDIAREWISFRL